MTCILVTGVAGFISANFVLDWLAASDEPVVNLDKLTYAGNPETLASLQGDVGHQLVQGDIGDAAMVSRLLAEHKPRADGKPYAEQISYVTDRPDHDRRYAFNARMLEAELGWKPAETFDTGIRKTVECYLTNPEWVANVQSGAYKDWLSEQYEGVEA
jgi:dTDP-D-glucose 4,6-dehydratase